MALDQTPVESFIATLPDPEGARAFWARLKAVHPIDYVRSPHLASRLLTLAAYSPFLAENVLRHPESVDWLRRESERGFDLVKTREQLSDELARFLMRTFDVDLRTGLARFKRRELLRIYLRDCLRIATLAEVTEELSHLADVILRHALALAFQEMSNRHGAPHTRDERGRMQPAEFAIVALGKLGCCELNYASDIDLLFLYSGEGETAGTGQRRDSLAGNKEFFHGVAQQVTQLVSGNSPEGVAYRVDLRLRPYGRDGDLVSEIHRAADYYHGSAENWERQALLRARAAAGNEAVVASFLDLVRDAIFTCDPQDYAMQEVRRAKEKIDRQVAARGGGFNVKLGQGGIREIEFIAQALQLEYAGREPWLRSAQTLIVLSRLTDKGYLSETERARLSAAYTFLRTVEHRLQMEHGAQTHTLPLARDRLSLLARRCGYAPDADPAAALQSDLDMHTAQVRAIYHRVFGDAPQGAPSQKPRVSAPAADADLVITANAPPPGRIDDERWRLISHAAQSIARLINLMPSREERSPELAGIEGAISASLERAINPLRSLRNLAAWSESCSTFLRDRRAAPGFAPGRQIEQLVERLAPTLSSQYLANLLIARPLLADALFADPARDTDTFRRQMLEALGEDVGPAARSDALRREWDRQVIAIGYRDVIGMQKEARERRSQAPPAGTGELRENNLAQTALAEATIQIATEIAFQGLGAKPTRHARVSPGIEPDSQPGHAPAEAWSLTKTEAGIWGLPFAILGLGRLGHAGMDYGSDLDLLVVFDDTAEWPPPHFTGSGILKPDELPQEFYARLTSELVRVLASITREGVLYRVDLRLRPEGKNGPLACGLNALTAYLTERASGWEHSAYLKAREVAGSPEFGAGVVNAISEACFSAARRNPHLRQELSGIRERLQAEKARGAPINVKWSGGGMTDVYFITRYLQLREGIYFPPYEGTGALITHLGARGVLTHDAARVLFDGYTYLRTLDHWMRLLLDRPTPAMPASDVALNDLAAALGVESPEELDCGLRKRMTEIHRVYWAIFS